MVVFRLKQLRKLQKSRTHMQVIFSLMKTYCLPLPSWFLNSLIRAARANSGASSGASCVEGGPTVHSMLIQLGVLFLMILQSRQAIKVFTKSTQHQGSCHTRNLLFFGTSSSEPKVSPASRESGSDKDSSDDM